LQKVDRRFLEASQDLGATRWQTFVRITIPLSLSGIKTGLLLVFIPAFGEFIIPMMIGGSRYMYVGSTITHYLLHAQSQHIGAAFTVVSGLLLLTTIIIGGICARIMYRIKSWS
jgi:spermidine/putrescine transport system permease protein